MTRAILSSLLLLALAGAARAQIGLPGAPGAPSPTPRAYYDPAGNGWCRYADDAKKVSFYSAVFPGAPKNDRTPRDVGFAAFIKGAHPELNGQATCAWSGSESDYDSGKDEEDAEYSDQMKHYQMTTTGWTPDIQPYSLNNRP